MSIFFRKPNQIFLVCFRILLIYGNLSLSLPLTGTMDTLENMWNKLSLLDSKENSVQCSEDSLARQRSRLLLAAKFITKRLKNIESVARTFKTLWRTQREIKIKDMGEILMFSNLRMNVILNEYWNMNLGHMISIW